MQKAKTLGSPNGLPGFIADYEIATTYAAMGDSDHALDSLKASADGGYSQPARLTGDTEWNALRQNLRFLELSKQVQHNAAPCEDTEFRAFDFWLGDTTIVSPSTATRRSRL